MFFANTTNKQRVKARYAKDDEQYFCPLCGAKVLLKEPGTKNAHFVHETETHCENSDSNSKTSWHRRMQNHFSDKYQEVIVSEYGEEHIADIVKDGVVIKFMDDDISNEEFVDQTDFFRAIGFHVIYIFDITNAGYKTIAQYAHPSCDKGTVSSRVRKVWELANSYIDQEHDEMDSVVALFFVFRENNQDHFKRVMKFCYDEEGLFNPREFVIARKEYDIPFNADPNDLLTPLPETNEN